MPSRNKRVLPQRAVSWNVLSGNVSSPSIMRIPLVTNTVRMPLVTGGIPFSMKRGEVHGLKHDRNSGAVPGLKHVGNKGANQETLESTSEKGEVGIRRNAVTLLTKGSRCPWCGESNISREMKANKRSLWRCLGCNRRWWASADNPRKMTQHRPKLSRQVYQGSFWQKLGGIGL